MRFEWENNQGHSIINMQNDTQHPNLHLLIFMNPRWTVDLKDKIHFPSTSKPHTDPSMNKLPGKSRYNTDTGTKAVEFQFMYRVFLGTTHHPLIGKWRESKRPGKWISPTPYRHASFRGQLSHLLFASFPGKRGSRYDSIHR